MPERDCQELLDSAFTKLDDAGVSLDHEARWGVATLTPLEKVIVIANDLFCEASNGGFDYWLQRRYCARGKVELQRVMAAIAEERYDADPLAAELVLAMCDAVDRSPPRFDPSFGDPYTEEDEEAYQPICDELSFVDSAYHLHAERMLEFNQSLVDGWDESLDPFDLPGAKEPPRPRRRIEPLAPSHGPVRFPSVQVGLSPDSSCALKATGIGAYDLYNACALALYLAGAPVDRIAAFVGGCEEVRHDLAAVVARCVETLDVDGTLARTGAPAAPEAVLAAVTWTPTYMLRQVADRIRARPFGGVLIATADLAVIDGGPAPAGFPVRELDLGEGLLPLADQAGEPDRESATFLLLDGSSLEGESEELDDRLMQLLELTAEHGALVALGLPEYARAHLQLMGAALRVEFVDMLPEPE